MNQILLFTQDLLDEKTARLTGRRLDHLSEVIRASKGDLLRAGLAGGNRGTAAVVSINDTEAVLELSLTSSPPPPLPLTLVVAVQRPKTVKKILQYASSAGIKSIWFVRTWRVDKSYMESPVFSGESIRENLVLGLEQSRDTIFPEVHLKERFKPFVQDELPAIIKGGAALVAHPTAETPCPRNISGCCTLALGPEGGFIPYEIDLLAAEGFLPVTIGERPLRTEFALPSLVGRLC